MFNYAVVALSEIWRVKFSNVHCVADILSGLKIYQNKAVVWIIDATLEDIRLGTVSILLVYPLGTISILIGYPLDTISILLVYPLGY